MMRATVLIVGIVLAVVLLVLAVSATEAQPWVVPPDQPICLKDDQHFYVVHLLYRATDGNFIGFGHRHDNEWAKTSVCYTQPVIMFGLLRDDDTADFTVQVGAVGLGCRPSTARYQADYNDPAFIRGWAVEEGSEIRTRTELFEADCVKHP